MLVIVFDALEDFSLATMNVVLDVNLVFPEQTQQPVHIAELELLLLQVHQFAVDNKCFLVYSSPTLDWLSDPLGIRLSPRLSVATCRRAHLGLVGTLLGPGGSTWTLFLLDLPQLCLLLGAQVQCVGTELLATRLGMFEHSKK